MGQLCLPFSPGYISLLTVVNFVKFFNIWILQIQIRTLLASGNKVNAIH